MATEVVVVVCGRREVKRRVREEEASALRRPFEGLSAAVLEPYWCSSSAFWGLSSVLPGEGRVFWRNPVARGALHTTITRDGADTQRVTQAFGAQCHPRHVCI